VKTGAETYGETTKAPQTVVTLLHKAEVNQSIAPSSGSAAKAAQRTVPLIERLKVNVESDSLRGAEKTTAPKGRGRRDSAVRMDQKRC
jgi:hypothetical protein